MRDSAGSLDLPTSVKILAVMDVVTPLLQELWSKSTKLRGNGAEFAADCLQIK